MGILGVVGRLLPDIATLSFFGGALAICTLIELVAPARREPPDRPLNLAIGVVLTTAQNAFGVAAGPMMAIAVNRVGGGLIALPTTGWGLVAGTVAYFLAMDLGDYLFHRAQHAWPALWSMHSLHHSDQAFGASTQLRHFWLEPIIKMSTTYLAVSLLFKTPPTVVEAWYVFSLYNFFCHTNTRIGFGRLSWLLNAPQYHRMHHAAASEYFDCNYASLLPIWDVVAGAYRRPRPEEYPRTGVDSGAAPATILDAVAWPWRWRRAVPRLAGGL
jgi:sterol desaturase/sphingolipid hydroxylase (fatty acid hydroxylase superfamily)